MIIKLHGETTVNKLTKIIKEVVTDIQKRAGLEENKFTLKDVELGVLFNVNGEKMMLSSEIDGVSEPFAVHVELDEKGNIKRTVDNEEESFLDDYSRAIAKGLESPTTEPIESTFNDGDLVEYDAESGGDLVALHYRHKTEAGLFVIRYFRNGILVGETGYKKKEA